MAANNAALLSNDAALTQDTAFRQAAGYNTATRLTLSSIIARVIKVILSMLGIIFIILLIYAGLGWMTSGGNEEKVGKAKKTITAAIIGLVIVLSAYAITVFVIDNLIGSTIGSGSTDNVTPGSPL